MVGAVVSFLGGLIHVSADSFKPDNAVGLIVTLIRKDERPARRIQASLDTP
jgi:hypothetical protein